MDPHENPPWELDGITQRAWLEKQLKREERNVSRLLTALNQRGNRPSLEQIGNEGEEDERADEYIAALIEQEKRSRQDAFMNKMRRFDAMPLADKLDPERRFSFFKDWLIAERHKKEDDATKTAMYLAVWTGSQLSKDCAISAENACVTQGRPSNNSPWSGIPRMARTVGWLRPFDCTYSLEDVVSQRCTQTQLDAIVTEYKSLIAKLPSLQRIVHRC